MKIQKNTRLLIFFALFFPAAIQTISANSNDTSKGEFPSEDPARQKRYQIQVKITFQEKNHITPWRLKNPSTRLGLATYIDKNQFIIPAHLLMDQTLLEVRSMDDPIPKQARLIQVNYESDLALIQVDNPGNLMVGLSPVVFPPDSRTAQPAIALTMGPSGETQSKRGRLNDLNLALYPEGRIELPYLEFSTSEKLKGVGELIYDSEQKSAIGLLNRFNTNSGEGRVIPSSVVHYFLNDQKTIPFKGFFYRPITDQMTREYYKIPESDQGVLIAEVLFNSTAYGFLKVEDVLVRVGNFSLDNKGRFDHPKYGKLAFSYLFHSGNEFGYKLGSKLPVEIIRGGKKTKIDLELKAYPEESIQIPHGTNRSNHPGYLISGGFVFLELSEFYLQEWGRNWRSNGDKKFLYLLDYHKFRRTSQDPKRYVFLSQVIPDELNNGYHDLRHQRVFSCNGKSIESVSDLQNEIAKTKSSEWVVIQLEHGPELVFRKSTLESLDKKVQENFGIPKLYMPPN